ncbi:MAG: hypothetical protein BWX74_00850 [Tenericutes bacterium ADurb.Bin087]|nr:MAG: hypothetical protein BWX74_00850 [Tenericutes bacterium ADurb.Bin087]
MNTKKIAALIRFAIAFIFLCGIVMVFVWYPLTVSITIVGPVPVEPTLEQNIQGYTQLAFYWLTSLPCFIILGIVWKITINIKQNDGFTSKDVKLLNKANLLLLIDLPIFLIGNLIFMFLKLNFFVIFHFFIVVVGLIVVAFIWIAALLIEKNVELQAETEGTI